MRLNEFDLELIVNAGSVANARSIKKQESDFLYSLHEINSVPYKCVSQNCDFFLPRSPSSLRHGMMSLMDDIT